MVEAHPAGDATIACVIANYNYAAYVAQAIDSALNQTRPFDQVIVIDDGSTDDSLRIIDRYRDRVVVLASENMGQTGACLKALAEVRSDYVYFLDADDFAVPHLVETLTASLAQRPVKIQFPLKSVDGEGRFLESIFPTHARGYDSPRMISDIRTIGYYVSPPTSGNVIRVEALRALPVAGLDPRGAVDGSLNLVLPFLGPVIVLETPLACRRVHGNSFGQYSRPTTELMQREIATFRKMRQEASRLMGVPEETFSTSERPLYVRERDLMARALGRSRVPIGVVAGYVGALRTTRTPLKQKVMLSAWALALLAAGPERRQRLVRARRSPVNRSQALNRLIRLLVRGRVAGR